MEQKSQMDQMDRGRTRWSRRAKWTRWSRGRTRGSRRAKWTRWRTRSGPLRSRAPGGTAAEIIKIIIIIIIIMIMIMIMIIIIIIIIIAIYIHNTYTRSGQDVRRTQAIREVSACEDRPASAIKIITIILIIIIIIIV